jgi:hypothetical protein
MLAVRQTDHKWQRSQEVTTELGHLFGNVGILFQLNILLENTKIKTMFSFWGG